MPDATLVDRYVQAAMRTVPQAQREDLATELRASIQDQIDARTEDGEDSDAERAVLEDLGDPEKLAAGYTDRPLYLIGPRYYLDWWRLLKLLLWIVPPLAAFGIALGQTLSDAALGEIIGSTVAGVMSAILHVFFWTTLVFAIIDRTTAPDKREPLVPWTVDSLPEQRSNGAQLSDAIGSVVFVVVAGIALVWDQLHGSVHLGGEWYSFMHPDLWPWWIIGLLVVMAADAVLHVAVYMARRWTYGLATVNAVIDALVVIPALWLLSQDRLLNAAPWIAGIPDDGAEVASILAVITGLGALAIGVLDAANAFIKARQARPALR